MSDCYVNVCGGIGNQLFQIAAGYAYSKKHYKNLLINISNWTASQGSNPNVYANNLLKNFTYYRGSTDHATKFEEEGFNYKEIPEFKGDVVINGYFQSLKYFENYKEEFVNQLDLPNFNMNFIDDDSVAFHIRRGDYAKYPQVFGDNEEYFRKLFNQFKDRKINVFTDSPDYATKFSEVAKFTIIRSASELKDLTALANHKTLVCSNSSFSWWASVLGVEKDAIYVPKVWLHDRDCSDIYYKGMIKT